MIVRAYKNITFALWVVSLLWVLSLFLSHIWTNFKIGYIVHKDDVLISEVSKVFSKLSNVEPPRILSDVLCALKEKIINI